MICRPAFTGPILKIKTKQIYFKFSVAFALFIKWNSISNPNLKHFDTTLAHIQELTKSMPCANWSILVKIKNFKICCNFLHLTDWNIDSNQISDGIIFMETLFTSRFILQLWIHALNLKQRSNFCFVLIFEFPAAQLRCVKL